jgi:hypothetical protein
LYEVGALKKGRRRVARNRSAARSIVLPYCHNSLFFKKRSIELAQALAGTTNARPHNRKASERFGREPTQKSSASENALALAVTRRRKLSTPVDMFGISRDK